MTYMASLFLPYGFDLWPFLFLNSLTVHNTNITDMTGSSHSVGFVGHNKYLPL